MSKKVITTISFSCNRCCYPAPELCPNYDTINRRCCDKNVRCSYHSKQPDAIAEKIKNWLPMASSSDLIFPNLTANTEIPEIFQYHKRIRKKINSKEKN